jgi:hypothetical protein
MSARPRHLFIVALLCWAGAALAAVPDGWRLVGTGEMRWFGFKLYDARLWAPETPTADTILESAFALELRYAREIPSQRLVDASIEEIERLGAIPAKHLVAWRQTLTRIFPDVRSGETIIGVHHPERGAEFFHQGQLTGRIADNSFARRFFAIWLDPRTREPDLRARLLGAS